MPSIPSTPSTTSPTSQHTSLTTPETASPTQHGMNPAIDENDLSDIWDLSPPITPEITHPPANGPSASHSQTQTSHAPNQRGMEIQQPHQSSQAHTRFQQSDASDIYSDLPSLRRTHINTGYRDGLTTGKARVIQNGFDEGFPLGIEIALRVGRILGVLEGAVGALGSVGRERRGKGLGTKASKRDSKGEPEEHHGQRGDSNGDEGKSDLPGTRRVDRDQEVDGQMTSTQSIQARRSEMELLLTQARDELSITALLDGLEEESLTGANTLADLGRIEEVIVRWERMVLGRSGRTARTILGDKKVVREETKLSPSPDETQA